MIRAKPEKRYDPTPPAAMKTTVLKKGLDIPIAGAPEQSIRPGNPIQRVALVGDDYIGMRPGMLVAEGEEVIAGQPLFTDKKNPGILFTAPGSGRVTAIRRGAKRRFMALEIELAGDRQTIFAEPVDNPERLSAGELRELLVRSGMWPTLRTRPYGKTPGIETTPAALFVTAADSAPLAPRPQVIIGQYAAWHQIGLRALRQLLAVPTHYCTDAAELLPAEEVDGLTYWSFKGPHPAGLASTHIHFIEPVHEGKSVWQIGYQDVIAIGHLLATGTLMTERVVALSGSGVIRPGLVTTRLGANLSELCRRELTLDELRLLSGSVLSGRHEEDDGLAFLGRFHNQVAAIEESSGRSIFNWLLPGGQRFSIRPVFLANFLPRRELPMNTALWGGRRAIYPLGTYDEVMPLDIIATSLLKALSSGNTEKAKALGCLELIEEDLDLCGYVCPGKNEFGPVLRRVLDEIEQGG